MKGTIKFIDLFAGIGGIRCGLELAAHEAGYKTECVFTSEINALCVAVFVFIGSVIVGGRRAMDELYRRFHV